MTVAWTDRLFHLRELATGACLAWGLGPTFLAGRLGRLGRRVCRQHTGGQGEGSETLFVGPCWPPPSPMRMLATTTGPPRARAVIVPIRAPPRGRYRGKSRGQYSRFELHIKGAEQ